MACEGNWAMLIDAEENAWLPTSLVTEWKDRPILVHDVLIDLARALFGVHGIFGVDIVF